MKHLTWTTSFTLRNSQWASRVDPGRQQFRRRARLRLAPQTFRPFPKLEHCCCAMHG